MRVKTANNLIVQIAYRFNPLHVSPSCRLLQHMEQFILRLKRRHLLGVLAFRHLDYKSFIIEIELKIFQIFRTRHHVAVKIVLKLVHTVNVDLGHPSVLKQTLLIIHSMLAE